MDFARAIAGNLGNVPQTCNPRQVGTQDRVDFEPAGHPQTNEMMRTFEQARIAYRGADVYVQSALGPLELAERMQRICEGTPFKLTMISNRGTQVWPSGSVYTELVDHARCRFEPRDSAMIGRLGQSPCVHLLAKVAEKFDVVNYTPLKEVDGTPGFSLAQGQ